MQNKDDDKFEVDLLLPFQTAKEKEQFISNFKSRSNKKPEHSPTAQHESTKFFNGRIKS
jgi:hypothetical protein